MMSTELAVEHVQAGNLWGYILIPANFTQHVESMAVEQKYAENSTLEGSRIGVRMDMSSKYKLE